MTARSFEYLDVEDLVVLATLVLGDPPPIRDIGLLGSAAARPMTAIGDQDAYPDVWTKAASLMQSLLKNHALVDGNKRLGWLATAIFLELNGESVTQIPNDAVYDLVMDATAGSHSVNELAGKLHDAARRGPS